MICPNIYRAYFYIIKKLWKEMNLWRRSGLRKVIKRNNLCLCYQLWKGYSSCFMLPACFYILFVVCFIFSLLKFTSLNNLLKILMAWYIFDSRLVILWQQTFTFYNTFVNISVYIKLFNSNCDNTYSNIKDLT